VPEQRRRFSPQFKAEAVQMVLETGKPIAEVARDLQVNEGTLGNWVNTWRRDHPEPDQPLSPVEKVRMNEMEDEIRRLRMENEFLKKQRPSSPGRSRSRALRVDRGGEGQLPGAVDVHDADGVAVVVLCLAVPGRDPHRAAPPAARRAGRGGVRRLPRHLQCRRVAAELNRQGTACSVGLIADLMRELGLKACQPRAYKVTTIHGGQAWRAPDLTERDFTAGSPGERLVGDITYLRTGEGWLYLSVTWNHSACRRGDLGLAG